jgi:very-short-patch-repair endonuclease
VLVAVLDMGWEDVKVATDYEGEHHWSKRAQIDNDIARFDEVTELGWIDVRVTARDTEGDIIRRIAAARARRV